MSFLPPLGLPVASLPGTASTTPSLPAPSLPATATPSPSGRQGGADVVTQPQDTTAVTPSRTMLEVRRAVEAELIANAQVSAAVITHPMPVTGAPQFYAAARKVLPV